MFKSCFDMRIKLIDYGVAIRDADVLVGDKLQPIGFRFCCFEYIFSTLSTCCWLISHLWPLSSLLRAPEILLGLPYTRAIDMWGVGCVLANVYLRFFLFNADSDFEMVTQISEKCTKPRIMLTVRARNHGGEFNIAEMLK